MNGVEALGLALGDGFLSDGDDAEAGLVNLGQNGGRSSRRRTASGLMMLNVRCEHSWLLLRGNSLRIPL